MGNQATCPYCGATVYIGNTTWSVADVNRTLIPTADNSGRMPLETRGIDRRLRSLETKVNLMLVLQCGMFALTALTLIMLALK